MATLRYDPLPRWSWVAWGLSRRAGPRASIEEYQGADEFPLSVARRHPVTLIPAVAACCGAMAVGVVAGAGLAVVPPATVFLAWRIWRWRAVRYVLTDQRLLSVDGIVYTRVSGLPLSSVLDVTARRSLAGRLFGYGDVTLHLSRDPEWRTFRRLSRPESLYYSILNLIAVRDMREETRAP